MEVFSQIFRYLIVIGLMIVMLGAALIIAPVSGHIGWRIYRSWSGLALKIFGVKVVNKFDGDESKLDKDFHITA